MEKVDKTKMVSNHSRPWIDPAVVDLLKELQEARKYAQRHRSQKNIDRYKVLLESVSIKLKADMKQDKVYNGPRGVLLNEK